MKKQDSGMRLPLRLIIILSGTFLLAFTYYHINYQNHLTEGGFVGLGTARQIRIRNFTITIYANLRHSSTLDRIDIQREIVRGEHLHLGRGLHGILWTDGTLFRMGHRLAG